MKRLVLPILLAASLPAADLPMTTSINAFTVACYRQLAAGDGNLILSPFNIANALSMALAGARGQTAEEIQSVLHVHYDTGYDAALADLSASLAKAGNAAGNELQTANGLWLQKGFPIQPAFERTLADHYHAPMTPLDFIGNADGARSQINRWTEEHTKEKIKNLLPAGSLDAQTRLVLTSAIYFYGTWQDPFVASRSQSAPFTPLTGPAAQANFMNQTSYFGYAETSFGQILEMRYAGTGFAFDVLLPKNPAGLSGMEKSLTPETLVGWLGNLASRNVQVSLPKFRAESAFSLRKGLSNMGMPAAFTSKADFSGIDPKRGLELSEVVHKAFVDVSEQGTEAAAATGITMRATAMRMPEPAVVFRANHPFLFLIRDTRAETVLFMGRLTNPH